MNKKKVIFCEDKGATEFWRKILKRSVKSFKEKDWQVISFPELSALNKADEKSLKKIFQKKLVGLKFFDHFEFLTTLRYNYFYLRNSTDPIITELINGLKRELFCETKQKLSEIDRFTT